MKKYTRDEVFAASLQYFGGDELAANVFFKYCLQDKHKNYYELTPDDMHHRLAREFARIEKKYPNPLSEKEIYELFENFRYICPQGSPMMGIGNSFLQLSLSNCIIAKPPEDTMSSIMDVGKNLANLFKRRCGVGTDLSNLRPDGSPVNNSAGSSTGAWSFADYYSNVCRMVGQNNRRGALMLSMDVRHPDIFKFVRAKSDLKKVTGANISIKLRDDFMLAVRDDLGYQLGWPVDAKKYQYSKTIRARDLWEVIVESATNFAEPGLLMWDTILKYLPAECYEDFKTVGVNPCAEIPASVNDSCRLISQNLKWYVNNPFKKNAYFDFDLLYQHTRIAQRLSDDLVDLEIEKLKKLEEVADTNDEKDLFMELCISCEVGRRTGLGTHGLADALARMCMRYDSDEAIELADVLYGVRKNASYEESAELASERGSFGVWEWYKEKDNEFIQSLEPKVIEKIKKYGRRNISNLTNAPTGSVAIVSQTTSGIEPLFRVLMRRRKKKNHGEEPKESDFIDDVGDNWSEYVVTHKNVTEWIKIEPNNKKLANFFVESHEIDWHKRIEMQAAIQKHIDHSISSTINLPKGTSKELVGELYMEAWEKGLKGVTIYVDESRSGVLLKNELKYQDALPRPKSLDCDIHQVSIKGEKWIVLVGLYEDRPYEIFAGLSDNIEFPQEYTKGKIIKGATFKTAPNRYDLKINGFLIKNIVRQFDNPEFQVLTRMVSLGLRHGAKPNYLVEQLQKDPSNDLTSYSKVLARVLKKYITDGTKVTSDKVCPECEKEDLIYSEGCVKCSCGWSKCS